MLGSEDQAHATSANQVEQPVFADVQLRVPFLQLRRLPARQPSLLYEPVRQFARLAASVRGIAQVRNLLA